MIIKSNCIDSRCREESKQRRDTRRQLDVLKGLSRAKGAQRGDFKLCRELDKTLSDYCKFKNPKDRKKITDEYYGRQKEWRENHYKGG